MGAVPNIQPDIIKLFPRRTTIAVAFRQIHETFGAVKGTLLSVNTVSLLRGQKVILDSDLAELYGVEVKHLNQQIQRNRKRFPEDFVFSRGTARA
jgi:ORF6N domain-containing protein